MRTNADLPEDAAKAREFGAEGIGLCRTEHMFLGDRLPIVQRMILAETDGRGGRRARGAARSSSAPTSSGILEAMDGLPVTIRLLDPPLHEFLPDIEELLVTRGARASSTTEGRKLLARGAAVARGRTRCSAPAGAASASSSPACTACRRRRSSRPRSRASRPAAIRTSRS